MEKKGQSLWLLFSIYLITLLHLYLYNQLRVVIKNRHCLWILNCYGFPKKQEKATWHFQQ